MNVATSLAGLLGGIIVEEKLEKKAKSHGLTMLIDVRDKTQQWCFDTYKNQFNRHMLCEQDPRVAITRDLAIAQPGVYRLWFGGTCSGGARWLEPLPPSLATWPPRPTPRAWPPGRAVSRGTDYCWNLPV